MTPNDALRAASKLEEIEPYNPVVAHLRDYANDVALWIYDDGNLIAADSVCYGYRVLPRVPGFASHAAAIWAARGRRVDVSGLTMFSDSPTANRGTIDKQRTALAKRLAALGLTKLAQALRDIHLTTVGDRVLAHYDPEGVPIRIRKD